MTGAVCGDRVALINEGSTFTDDGFLVSKGDVGWVIGFRGLSDVIVQWDAGVGIASASILTIINRLVRKAPRG